VRFSNRKLAEQRSVRRPTLPAVENESIPYSYRDTHASESDDDIPVTRKPGVQRRRVIVESDSSDDQGGSCAPAGNRIATSQRSRRVSADSSHESSSTYDNEQEYNLQKHYDSSIGSLRDFIISDSDCDSIESGHEPKGTIIPDDPSAIFERIGSPELDFSRLAISHATSLTEVSGRTDYKATAQRIFDELNRRVFGGKLSETKLEWNNRLLTTAGQAKCRRLAIIHPIITVGPTTAITSLGSFFPQKCLPANHKSSTLSRTRCVMVKKTASLADDSRLLDHR